MNKTIFYIFLGLILTSCQTTYRTSNEGVEHMKKMTGERVLDCFDEGIEKYDDGVTDTNGIATTILIDCKSIIDNHDYYRSYNLSRVAKQSFYNYAPSAWKNYLISLIVKNRAKR